MKVTQGCPFSWDGRDLNRRTKSLKVSTDFCQRTWRQRQSFFCSSPLMTKERTGKRPLSGKGPQSFHKCKSSINFANQSASRYCAEKFEACFLAVRVLASRAQTRLSEVPFNLRFMKYTCSDMTFYWISFPANQLKLSSTSKRNREEPSYECEGIERKKGEQLEGKNWMETFRPTSSKPYGERGSYFGRNTRTVQPSAEIIVTVWHEPAISIGSQTLFC